MYTIGEPNAVVRRYLDWIHSPEGQNIVKLSGYVPLTFGDEEQAAAKGTHP